MQLFFKFQNTTLYKVLYDFINIAACPGSLLYLDVLRLTYREVNAVSTVSTAENAAAIP